jgi:hypothetical protein
MNRYEKEFDGVHDTFELQVLSTAHIRGYTGDASLPLVKKREEV